MNILHQLPVRELPLQCLTDGFVENIVELVLCCHQMQDQDVLFHVAFMQTAVESRSLIFVRILACRREKVLHSFVFSTLDGP